jgi:hypothetical protein
LANWWNDVCLGSNSMGHGWRQKNWRNYTDSHIFCGVLNALTMHTLTPLGMSPKLTPILGYTRYSLFFELESELSIESRANRSAITTLGLTMAH